MPLSNNEQNEMFGQTLADIDEMYEQSISGGMLILSIISDAQAMMNGESNEPSRQALNVAKYLISKHGVQQDSEGRML